MHPVINPYPEINPDSLAPVKYVRYQARDGLVIPAYLTLPRGREPKDLPLIIMPHGGPFARDNWEYDPTVQFFANRGYAVLQPQFRGSTGHGKNFVDRGYGEVGTGCRTISTRHTLAGEIGPDRFQAGVRRRRIVRRLRRHVGRYAQSRTLSLRGQHRRSIRLAGDAALRSQALLRHPLLP